MSEKDKEILSPSKRKKKRKRIIILCIAVIILMAFVVIAAIMLKKDGSVDAKKEIMTTNPFVSTIELTVSGSGTVEPYDRYEIVSLVSGDIMSAPYEEGDMVNEDDVVYVIDHEEQDKAIESAKNSLTKSKIRNKIYLDEKEFNKTLAKYTVRAEEDGIISDFEIEVDDKVTANAKLGTIQNFDEIIATVPFNAAQFEKISLGDKATVYLYPSMFVTEGVVTYKSYKTTGSIGGAVVYDVEITIDGSNLTLTDTSVSATVHTLKGDVESPSSGTLGYEEAVNIFAEVSGEVLSVPSNIKNGAVVKEGDILFLIDSADFLEEKTLVEFEYHDLELNLENAEDRLENYNIKAPISGTVITKNSKKGDTISSGNNSSTLMVIADMSAMKFTFQADETDIDKIKVGQEVIVTADAVENKVFIGVVESVATEGVANNGVSYYDVEVVIQDYGQNNESGALRSGMNVSAEIVYERAENALCLPVSAITTIGNESYVFVKDGNASDNEEIVKEEKNVPAISEDNPESTDKKPEKTEENIDEIKAKPEVEKGGAAMSQKENDTKRNDREGMIKERLAQITPEGFTAVKVVTGASNGVSIAILSGIDETDEVYIAENDNVLAPVISGSQLGLTGGMGGFGGMNGGFGGARPGAMGAGMPGGMRR